MPSRSEITEPVAERRRDHEPDHVALSPERNRSELVHRLLTGVHVDLAETGQLGYELDAWHLGIVATGTKAMRALRDLEAALGCELLLISHGESVWAWLGRASPIKTADLGRMLAGGRDTDGSLAFGEPCVGVEGWRLTHHQSREAWGVAIRIFLGGQNLSKKQLKYVMKLALTENPWCPRDGISCLRTPALVQSVSWNTANMNAVTLKKTKVVKSIIMKGQQNLLSI